MGSIWEPSATAGGHGVPKSFRTLSIYKDTKTPGRGTVQSCFFRHSKHREGRPVSHSQEGENGPVQTDTTSELTKLFKSKRTPCLNCARRCGTDGNERQVRLECAPIQAQSGHDMRIDWVPWPDQNGQHARLNENAPRPMRCDQQPSRAQLVDHASTCSEGTYEGKPINCTRPWRMCDGPKVMSELWAQRIS